MAKARPRVKIRKPPILFDRSQGLIKRLQAELQAPLFTYWSSNSGSVCADDVVALHDHCRTLSERHPTFYLFIKSAGGCGRSALRIVHLLRQHCDRLRVLVPLECASAATMMALGADDVLMGPLAFLTAVDTSLRHELSPSDIDNELVSVSQDELGRVLKLWGEHAAPPRDNPVGALMPYVHPLVMGAADRASSLSIRLCREILSYHTSDAEVAQRIASQLNSGYPSHDYPITLREAQRIGLAVSELSLPLNEGLLELHAVYSEMGQRALTDFDEENYHNNEIATVIERVGSMIYFQIDKDWHYRQEERRWTALNDNSRWTKVEQLRGRIQARPLHIR
jgi:hypothetical protein